MPSRTPSARSSKARTTAAAAPRRFRPSDLLKQIQLSSLAVSPDGATVVYGRRTIEKGEYRSGLWRVSFGGGRPERITAAGAVDWRPRFSPDGRRLLFLSSRSGRTQPWVMGTAGGEPQPLAEFDGNVRAAEWSPDGRHVLVVAPSGEDRYLVGPADDPVARRITDFTWRLDGFGVRDQFHSAWIVGANGGKPARVTDPTYEVFDAFWSPSGDRIGFLADLRDEAAVEELAQAWSIPAAGATQKQKPKPKPLASLAGAIAGASWGPDGSVAVVGVDLPGWPEWANYELFVSKGGASRVLGRELDRSAMNFSFGDLIETEVFFAPVIAWQDASHVLALVTDRGRCIPHRFGLDGTVAALAGGDIVASSMAAAGDAVAVIATDRGRPGEVYAVEDGALRPLTSDGSRWLRPYRRDPEPVDVPHPDGHEVGAWLLPAGRGRRGPLVLQIHGGPHGSHSPTPWLEMVALAGAGIHVLYANPRGSAGYGEKFTGAIHGAWGEDDDSDLMRAVDWAIEQGLADPKRIGVMGLSYGGYMTNWLLGHHPGRFAAGVSENPVTDWIGMFGGSDMTDLFGERFVGIGTLPDGLREFLKRSPWVDIHRNHAPLLLLQSENDMRCPPAQTELVFAILRSLGRPVEMVRYPGEPHGMLGVGRPDRRVDRLQRIVGWFERHLRA